MLSAFDFALNAIIAVSLAGTGMMALISLLQGCGTSLPSSSHRWTIALLVGASAGLCAVLLAIGIDRLAGVYHTDEVLKSLGLIIGFLILIVALIAQAPVAEAGSSTTIIQPDEAAQNAHNAPPLNDHRLPVVPIRTAMNEAHGVRNPVAAWTNQIATNAQIAALANAARLAEATAKTAEAEAVGMDAILRRDEKFAEYHARQHFRSELAESKRNDQQEIVRDATHRRELAAKRRDKEKLEAERARLSAKHGVEAAKKFKDRKFDLGEKRAQARIADADVDRATADAAIRQLGGVSDEATKPAARPVDVLLADLRQRIVEGEASGADTTTLRAALGAVEEVFGL